MVLIYRLFTCCEWGVVDFACAATGAVALVYETDSARQTAGIAEEVDLRHRFAGDSSQRAQTLEQIQNNNHPGMKRTTSPMALTLSLGLWAWRNR